MNADHDFKIGKNHIVCQDYALSGVRDDFAYAIVCDGCSASDDVDIGSRLIAMSARDAIMASEKSMADFDGTFDYEDLAKEIIHRAKSACCIFRTMHLRCLDSTLMMAAIKGNLLRACIYGDGVFVHKSLTGRTHTIHIDFTNNAPSYPSYYLDPVRQKQYLEAGGKKNVVHNFVGYPVTNGIIEKTFDPFEPVTVSVIVEPGDSISLISDGINSFRCSNNDPIEWSTLVDEFTGYKNTSGVFAQRRMTAFKRKCQTDLMTHSDDISIASIIV
jgi:serine/threonine protein phosphatase PrpC